MKFMKKKKITYQEFRRRLIQLEMFTEGEINSLCEDYTDYCHINGYYPNLDMVKRIDDDNISINEDDMPF